jgi:hypothetical protein
MQSTTLSSGVPIGPTGAAGGDIVVDATRVRQTARPTSPFRDVLASGVGILVRGAEVATSVVGGPVMAAAVRDAGLGAANAVAGSSTVRTASAAGPTGPMTMAGPLAGPGSGGTTSLAGSSGVPANLAMPGGDQSDMATMQAMQRESQVFNMQLLELQEDVQQENRRFTTVSNVLRAKHDTAKAAVSNIRA